MPIEKVEFEFPEPGEQEDILAVEGALNTMPVDLDEKKSKEVEVEVVDDTPPVDRGKVASAPPDEVSDEELQSYSEKVQKRIKHFTKGFHDQRRAAEQALREKQELENIAARLVAENNQLKGTVNKNQEVMLEHVKRLAVSEFEDAKVKFKSAYDAGDSDGLVTAQDALTNAKLKLEKVFNIQLTPLQEQAPVVKAASSTAPDTRAVAWQAENPWFGTDDEMTSLALGLHQRLVKQGIDPAVHADDYYEKINSRMREVFPDRFSDDSGYSGEKAKHKSTVVAPATRSTAPKKIVLTKTQVALAKRLGVPLVEYAKQVAYEMRKQSNG